MFETTLGAIVAVVVGVVASLILLLPMRVLERPLFRKPAAKPELPKAAPITAEQEHLTRERRALTTAWRREARECQLDLAIVPLVESETERLARLITDGITTRGNAIHRLTAMVRQHSRPDDAVVVFLASMRAGATEPQS